jgi:hypothetical protein
MALDLAKLANVRSANGKTVARCPACAEAGDDNKGEHLVIHRNDSFACVMYAGEDGKAHRRRIFELAGIKDAETQRWKTLDDAANDLSRKLRLGVTRKDVYRDIHDNDIFAIIRFDDDTTKAYRPFHYTPTGWAMGDPPTGQLFVYNLPCLTTRPEERVYVTEGEKAACAAGSMGLLATTSPYGAKSAHKTDWSPLAGRDVVILPDNDEEGTKYATNVAMILSSLDSPASVRIVTLSQLPPKGDIVDWLSVRSRNMEAHRQELETLVESTPKWVPATTNDSVKHRGSSVESDPDSIKLKAKFFELERQKLPVMEKRRQMASLLVDLLHERGKFFYHAEIRDHKTAMYFDTKRKLLLRLSDPEFLSWLALFSGINRAEPEFNYLHKAIEDEALEGKTNGIVPETFWVRRSEAIYLSNGDGQIVRITAGHVEIVDNGTDNVLFTAGDTLASWKLCSPSDPFECKLFRNASFQEEYGLDLLRLWTISLPANHACKPPLLLTGAIRSGKTLTIRGIPRLFGFSERIHEPTPTDEGKRDFWVSVNTGGLFCLDNVDSHIRWLADAVAAASTGGSHERKKNYEDTKRINLLAKAWVALTSANPTFANDSGLADRLYIIRMGISRQETVEEEKLLSEVTAKRDAGLSFIAHILASALADKTPVSNLNKRHPEFAALAVRIGRSLGREKEAIIALTEAEKDKPKFCLENDTLGSAIMMLVTADGFTGTADQLLKKLCKLDQQTFGSKWTAKGVGRRLGFLWPHLSDLFKCRLESKQGTKHYTIEAK